MKKTILTTAAVTLLAITAQAAPIQGTIDINGFGSYVLIDKTANTVDFVDIAATPGNAIVSNGDGDFSALLGSFATYVDFTYAPLTVVNPLWSLVAGGYSFDLLAINSINEAGVGLVLTGSGMLHAPGFDDTFGTWSFSADTTTGATFTFSSQTTTVPDGGTTVMLLGAALSGLGLIRRKLA